MSLNNLLLSDGMVGVIGFALGMAIVFLGILVLIISITLMGKIMNKANKVAEAKKQQEAEKVAVVETVAIEENNDELTDEIKAAIVAAISAYYFGESSTKTCEFKVKKIKR